jgi:hypothetical protein
MSKDFLAVDAELCDKIRQRTARTANEQYLTGKQPNDSLTT